MSGPRAIILAAGKGTRMKSERPKVLHEICGRPLLWYVVRALRAAGVGAITVVTNPQIESYVQLLELGMARQDEQLGTGHAVQTALAAMNPGRGPILIASGDMPLVPPGLFRAVLDAVDERTVLALVTARMPLPSNFGRVIRRGKVVDRIVELRDCTPAERDTDEMNAGIYAFDESALRGAVASLRNDNAQGEYYLTDTIEILVRGGKSVKPIVADDHRTVLGINDRAELALAGRSMNEHLCREHMLAGVTIVDPATTYFEPGVEIGRDTTIHPGTIIGGATVIGQNCEIGPRSRLRSMRVGNNVRITESVVTDSSLGDDVSVGPFAQIRNGALLHRGVRIGNFTEVKASELHENVKANHLSYLGDATVGRNTNIGAASITCNFDGKDKHRTTIGENVKIGSDTMLRAPVTLGDGATTGAGSVVIRDVAPGETVAGNPAKPLQKKVES